MIHTYKSHQKKSALMRSLIQHTFLVGLENHCNTTEQCTGNHQHVGQQLPYDTQCFELAIWKWHGEESVLTSWREGRARGQRRDERHGGKGKGEVRWGVRGWRWWGGARGWKRVERGKDKGGCGGWRWWRGASGRRRGSISALMHISTAISGREYHNH